MFTNLLKAVVAAAATPIGVAADLLTLPESSYDPHRGPFDHTAKLLKSVKDNFNEVIDPKEKS